MSEIKLLPCPFCGGEELAIGSSELHNYVMCTKCLCKTSFLRTKAKTIETWNTRKPMQEIVERLEERIRILDNTSDINYPSVDIAIKEGKRIIEIVKEVGGMND